MPSPPDAPAPVPPAEPERPAGPRWLWPVLLAVLAVFLILRGLGAGSLHDLDEAKHALIAETVLESGDWLTLHSEGEPYFKKPPLKFWLTALAFRLLGVSETTVRLWSALFALGAVAVTWRLGRRLDGPLTGLFAAFVLLTSTQFLYNHAARSGTLDSACVCLFATAVWAFLGAGERPWRFVAACAAAGLCGMIKHLGFTLEILVLLGVLGALDGTWRRLDGRTVALGVLVCLAIVLPWHLAMWLRHGAAFTDMYVGTEVVRRVTSLRRASPGPTFYAIVLKDGLFPWSLLLPAALVWSTGRALRERARAAWTPLVWMLLVALAIQPARVKLPWYVLPAYPALAVLSAAYARRALRDGGRLAHDLVLVGVAAVAILSPTTAGRFNPFAVPAQSGMITVDLLGRWGIPLAGGLPLGPVVAAAAVALAAAALLLRRRDPGAPVLARGRRLLLAVAAAVALLGALLPLRQASTRSDLDLLVRGAAERGIADRVTVGIPDARWRPFVSDFYLDRLPGGWDRRDRDAVVDALAAGRLEGAVLVDREDFARLRAESGAFRRRAAGAAALASDTLVLLPAAAAQSPAAR